MPRQRATRAELQEQLIRMRQVLADNPNGLTAPQIRVILQELYGLRLDARILRLRLATLLERGEITAWGATRGRRYRPKRTAGGWDGSADSLFAGLPRPRSRPEPQRRTPPPPRPLPGPNLSFELTQDEPVSEAERARHISALNWHGAYGYFIEYEPRDSMYPDALHVGPTGRIPTFISMIEAVLHANRMGFDIDDPTQVFGEYDLDHIEAWCANPRTQDIEYELFVHVLGLIAQLPDIELDEELGVAHDASDVAFSKLLKSTDPTLLPGEPFPYIAEWTPEDIANMKRTFELGLRALRNRLVAWPPQP